MRNHAYSSGWYCLSGCKLSGAAGCRKQKENEEVGAISMLRVNSRRELLKTRGLLAGAGWISSLLPKNAMTGTLAQQGAAQPAEIRGISTRKAFAK